MKDFEWAEGNLQGRVEADVSSPRRLQEAGVQVYFAPQVDSDRKLVNLTNGRVEQFFADERRPQEGYYADFDSLERFCRREGLPLQETDAQAVLLPVTGPDAAGDPLDKEGY